MSEYFKGFMTGLILITLICSNPAFAYYSENYQNTNYNLFFEEDVNNLVIDPQNNQNTSNNTNNENLANNENVQPISTTFSCDLISLTNAEANAILNLAGEGFFGEEITDGIDEKADGTNLEGLELVGESTDGKSAVIQPPPTQASEANRFSILSNRAVDGPFGVGVILDDTLRVGRCDGLDTEDCRIYEEGLSIRTSGKGFVSDVKNAFGTLINKDDRDKVGLSDEEYQKMQENFLDNNEPNFTVAGILPTDKIPNSFVVNQYSATQATNCTNSACIISTYSAFDKYFNSWYSVDLVASNFGPTLLNGAKRFFGATRRNQDGSLLSRMNQWYEDLSRKVHDIPGKTLGLNRGLMYQERINQYGLGKQFQDLTIQKKLFSTGAKGRIFDLVSNDADILKLTPIQKEQFFKAITDLRAFARDSQLRVGGIEKKLKAAFATGNKNDQLKVAQELAEEYKHWDDILALDFPEWIKDSGNLSGFEQFTVRKNLGADGVGYINLAQEGAFNTTNIFEEFSRKGNWDSWANTIDGKTFNSATGKGLRLYELRPSRTVETAVSPDDLTRYLGLHGSASHSASVRSTGEVLPLNQANIDAIKSGKYPGTIDIVVADWAPKQRLNASGVMEDVFLSPNELAEILTQKRIYGRINTANRNLDDIYYGLRDRPDFTGGRSLGWLDSQLQKEKNFLTEYYKNPSVGIWAGTVKPIGYWQVKKGLGYEQFSAFMLPDTWTQLEVSQGVDRIYADSFIDFFANEGSDQGDLFGRIINSPVFIWNFIATKAAESNSYLASDLITKITGNSEGITTEGFPLTTKTIMRDEVENIAFYSHNEDCSGCKAGFNFSGDSLTVTVNAPSKIDAYVVEATTRDVAEQKGATLIAYTHHSNLAGSDGKVPGGEINLVDARANKETCEDAIRGSLIGFALPKGASAGLVIAGAESLGYALGFGPGLIATIFMQLLVTPDLQDCVDDKEGYYIHFYDPPVAKGQASKSSQTISATNVTDTFSNLTNSLKESASEGNPVAGALDELAGEFEQFANTARRDNLLQAKIKMLPPNVGTIVGKEVFYIWYNGNMMPTGLKTDGKMVISDGNNSVETNFEEGSMSINGEKIIDNKKEIIGLAINDTRVPAEIIPSKVSTVSAPNTNETVFEVTSAGEVYVREQKVLDCIRQAIEKQSGITYSGNELSQVFGNLAEINTEIYEKVFVRNNEIHLEGSGARTKGGATSKFIIDGFWNSRLVIDSNRNVVSGKFIGMAFENGSIVINKETNELVIWLRHHKNAILTNKEVSGLNAKLTSVENEEACPVPAIQLEALGFAGDELGQQKVENFNSSMETLGPFTQFTTDSKIYQFYSKRNEAGECKDHFRVIDKDTGRVLTDSEIVGGIVQDTDGKLSFSTADGKNHTLDFDAENGVPKLSYNGAPAETLRTAQGPNGSFWYDPNTGKWYPENGLQIPLGQSFKDNGVSFGADKDGNITGTAVNPMTFNIGQGSGSGFNIPSIPQTLGMQALFIMIFLVVAFYITRKEEFE